jgi:NAD(P)-dependent dehydrogenase (short-subunit alcohol dehydrogenase family)
MFGQANGKRVVVAGGGQQDGPVIGNGRAMAVLFARYGADVLVVDRELDRAQATVAQIAEEGKKAHAVAADVSVSEDCKRIISHAVETLGGVDVLINNVGYAYGDADAENLTEEVWDLLMDTNLKGMWLTSRAALPVMRKAGGGVIINISSVASMGPGPFFAYTISKNGVNMMTARMARENAPHNIRVHCIMPGSTETSMLYKRKPADMSFEDYKKQRAKSVPLGRLGTAWDVAHAALFFASDEASYITGAILPVDGGVLTR